MLQGMLPSGWSGERGLFSGDTAAQPGKTQNLSSWSIVGGWGAWLLAALSGKPERVWCHRICSSMHLGCFLSHCVAVVASI